MKFQYFYYTRLPHGFKNIENIHFQKIILFESKIGRAPSLWFMPHRNTLANNFQMI